LAHGLAIGVAMVPAAEGGIDTEDDLMRANARWSTLTLPALS
jgi:3-deoxy-manno-octulosonate cytidylyltransferase (CMP-KDO synthetase)